MTTYMNYLCPKAAKSSEIRFPVTLPSHKELETSVNLFRYEIEKQKILSGMRCGLMDRQSGERLLSELETLYKPDLEVESAYGQDRCLGKADAPCQEISNEKMNVQDCNWDDPFTDLDTNIFQSEDSDVSHYRKKSKLKPAELKLNLSLPVADNKSSDLCQLPPFPIQSSPSTPSIQLISTQPACQTEAEHEISSHVLNRHTTSAPQCETDVQTAFQIVEVQSHFPILEDQNAKFVVGNINQGSPNRPAFSKTRAGQNCYTRRQWSNPDWGPCMQSFVVDPKCLKFYVFLGKFWLFKR